MKRRRSRRTTLIVATLVAAVFPERGDAEELALSAEAAMSELTHPTFTAEANLDAQFVHPVSGDVATNSSITFDLKTSAGAGVELAINGAVVPTTQIGKKTVDGTTGETHYFYYGVALRPGPNDVTITALGAHGSRGTPRHANIFGQGPVTRTSLSVSGPMRADGVSPNIINVQATDAWQHPALAGATVRITVLSGDVRLESTTDATHPPPPAPNAAIVPLPSAQVLELPVGSNGMASVRLVPGLVAGNVDIRVTCGNLEAVGHFFLTPNVRKPLVTGLITGGIGAIPGDSGAPDDAPDGVNTRHGRVAIYATGALDEKTLATLAYDTANRLEQTATTGAFVDDPNERPYTTYGDASVRRDDALSRDHLFAQIDRGQSSLTWGEFAATTSASTNVADGYNQLVDGARLVLADTTHKISAFVAKNDVAFDRRVFGPTGLASTGQALYPDIVVGSEIVTLVALDRRSGAIVDQTVLTRNVDYVLDDATGQFRFINIPLPFDDLGNPQQVVLTYEYTGTGTASETVGGRAELAFKNVRLGTGYVNDSSGASNMTLLNADLGGPLKNGSWSLTDGVSRGNLGFTPATPAVPSAGNAIAGSLSTSAGLNTVSANFDTTTAGFSNPFGGLSTPGLADARATFTHRLPNAGGDISLEVDRQANGGVGVSDAQSEAALRFHRVISKWLGFTLGIVRQAYRTQSPAKSTAAAAPPVPPVPAETAGGDISTLDTMALFAANYSVGQRVTIDASRTQTLDGTPAPSQPNESQLQVAYRLGDAGRAFVRETVSSAPTQSFAESTVGLTTAAAATRSTEFGIERTLSPTLAADSEYLVERTASGSDLYAALGVRERVTLSPSLKGDAYLQQANAAGQNAIGFTAYGASLSFTDAKSGFHSTASLQQRNGGGAGTTYSLAAAGAIVPDVSLFASIIGSRAATSFSNDARVGLAWRAGQSDRNVTLAQYEKIGDSSTAVTTRSGVVSLEQFYRADRQTDISARYAYKIDGDSAYAAQTSLFGLRVDRRVGDRVDIGVEGRRTFAPGIAGTTNVGIAAEIGVRVADRMRVAAGYNFKNSVDPTLASTPTKCGFYLTVTSVVDQLLGWGRRR